jgi:hypothetical protein
MIESLPNRPLNPPEVCRLIESGQFKPLSLKQMPPEETPVRFDEATEDLDGLNGPGMVRAYSLIHTTEEYGTTIAFSEEDEEWVRVAMHPLQSIM